MKSFKTHSTIICRERAEKDGKRRWVVMERHDHRWSWAPHLGCTKTSDTHLTIGREWKDNEGCSIAGNHIQSEGARDGENPGPKDWRWTDRIEFLINQTSAKHRIREKKISYKEDVEIELESSVAEEWPAKAVKGTGSSNPFLENFSTSVLGYGVTVSGDKVTALHVFLTEK